MKLSINKMVKENDEISIDPNNLKFFLRVEEDEFIRYQIVVDGNNIEYPLLDVDVKSKYPYGTVYYDQYDRCPDETSYVVIDCDKDSVYVIYPRIRMNELGEIELGVDKSKEPFYAPGHVDCNPGLSGNWYCICGGLDTLDNDYKNTFEKVNPNYKYIIHKEKRIKSYRCQTVASKEKINQLDIYMKLIDISKYGG